MIIINNKEIRNTVEQVHKNKDDIEDLQESELDVYTKTEANAKFLAKTNLTDYSINDIIVADSEIQSGEVDLRAVSAQDVKSEISLDPTSAIIKTTSGTNNSTIGVSGTEVDITTGSLKYNGSEVVKVNSSPTFENVIIDNESYTSNIFQGYVIEYNESGDNNEGYIKMNGHSPELYNYNDHLHSEYGNSASLEINEDITVYKEGYSDYPDGHYEKSFDLIDTLDDYGTRITTLEQSGGVDYNNVIINIPAASGSGGHPTIDDLVDVNTEITASQYNKIVAAVEAAVNTGNYPNIILWLGETGLFRHDYVFKPNWMVFFPNSSKPLGFGFNTDSKWECADLNYYSGTFSGVYSVRIAPISGKYYITVMKDTVTTA